MKSNEESAGPLFRVLHARLLAEARNRIHNGEFSERALAKRLGVSQPQLHNVLKGVRKLQPVFADGLLEVFGLTVLALATRGELSAENTRRQSALGFEAIATQRPGTLFPERPELRSLRKKAGSELGEEETKLRAG